MADIKISQLGAAIAVGDTDLLPIVSGGNTLKATAAQVKEHSIGNTNISSIGDGSVTGAINALNTDKQPKTLDTPLTIGGVSKTTVEAALGELVSENQTLTTSETQTRASIAITNDADTNTQGSTIKKYTQFYKNGVLCKATANISANSALTLNSNYVIADNVTKQLNALVKWKKVSLVFSGGWSQPTWNDLGIPNYSCIVGVQSNFWIIFRQDSSGNPKFLGIQTSSGSVTTCPNGTYEVAIKYIEPGE